jgi:hypothetical protein
MDIPIDVTVHCTDGECGRSTCVIVNPVLRTVTHVVVREKAAPHMERLVGLKWVDRATPDLILLSCTRDRFSKMLPYVETQYLQDRLPDFRYGVDEYRASPYRVPALPRTVEVKHHRIPPGELAIRRGTRVRATDGRVGAVDEFLVDPDDSHITHLVLREGHLWDPEEVTIPVSEIDRIDGGTVHLKLGKQDIEALPGIPVRRAWL